MLRYDTVYGPYKRDRKGRRTWSIEFRHGGKRIRVLHYQDEGVAEAVASQARERITGLAAGGYARIEWDSTTGQGKKGSLPPVVVDSDKAFDYAAEISRLTLQLKDADANQITLIKEKANALRHLHSLSMLVQPEETDSARKLSQEELLERARYHLEQAGYTVTKE